MRRSSLRGVLALGASVALAGCSWIAPFDEFHVEETPDAGMPDASLDAFIPPDSNYDAGPPPLTVDEFVRGVLQAYCERVLNCESKVGFGALVELYCHPDIQDLAVNYASALDIGGVSVSAEYFDGDAARACLEALEAVPGCALSNLVLPDVCDSVSTGTLEDGASCVASGDCASRNCVFAADSCGAGICTARGDVGAACDDDDACGSGLVCVDSSCVTRPGLGGACNDDIDCAEGLLCKSHLCVVPGDLGDSCASELDGDTCNARLVCSGSGTSATCTEGQAVGAACSSSAPCAVGGRCISDVCVDIAHPFESCVANANCPATFYCDGDTCQPLPALGDDCNAATDCIIGNCVDGTCVLGELGDACGWDLDCPMEVSSCTSSVCTAFRAEGESCATGDCERGTYCEPTMRVCQACASGT